MTLSTDLPVHHDNERTQFAAAGPRETVRLLRAVQATTAAATLGAVACLAIAFELSEWRIALAASTLAIVAAISGATLCVQAMLRSRIDAYRRGHLDGWMRGWHGHEPDGHPGMFR